MVAIRAKYPEGSRPRPISSFDLPRTPLSQRLKLAVVFPDDWEDDLFVWRVIDKVASDDKGRLRLDTVIFARHPEDAAARWGYWHWCPVRLYGESEEDEFLQEADRLVVVGPKEDALMAYYRDLAKYYKKPVSWASPKE